MFAPFSQLSQTESKVYGLLAYYSTIGVKSDNPELSDYLVSDTGKSKQVIYNIKTKLRKKGLLTGPELNDKYLKLVNQNEFNFKFIINDRT